MGQVNILEVDGEGLGFILTNLEIDFLGQAFHGDELLCAVAAANPGASRFDLYYTIQRDGAPILRARTAMACFDYQRQRATRMPERVRESLPWSSFEHATNGGHGVGMDETPWTTRSSRPIYENPWIAITEHQVVNPGGNDGIYGVVHYKNQAIGIVPVDEAGNTWLVGQFRYPLGRYSWELPEGGCPADEEPLAAAKRELHEETGLSANRWDTLCSFDVSNCCSDETGHLFLARELTEGQAHPDDDERLAVRKLPFAEALEMVRRGEITDLISITGLLQAERLLNEN